MSVKRIIGGVIIALPFLMIFISSWVSVGPMWTVGMFAGIALMLCVMGVGVELVLGD